MPQFTVEKPLQKAKTTCIEGNDAHHIIDVLRLRAGDRLVLSDACGNRFAAKIEKTDRKTVTVLIEEELKGITKPNITLAQAIIKHSQTEFIIVKAVELGCTNIIPFTSSRTIPKYTESAATDKIGRWNRIALESAKQCGLPFKPTVLPITPFEKVVSTETDYHHRLMFYEGEKNNTLKDYFSRVGAASVPRSRRTEAAPTSSQPSPSIILIGPEGGFTPKEIELAKSQGFTTVSLGDLILRVDTATLTALTLVKHFLGEL